MNQQNHVGKETPDFLRLAIVQRYFPHYRKPIFDLVAQAQDVRLELLCQMLNQPLPAAGIALPVALADAPYAVSVRNIGFTIAGKSLVLQPGVVWRILTGMYDVVIFEGAPQILSTVLLLVLLRLNRRTKSVAWVKGWFGPGDLDGSLGWIRRWLVRNADICLCYGRETRKQLLTLGVPDHRIVLNQNTVEVRHLLDASPVDDATLPTFANAVLKTVLESSAGIVSSIGRQTEDKRFAELIRAFVELSPRHPDVVLVLAGSGPEAPNLRTLINELGAQRVYLTGPLSAGDAYELFRRSDLFVFPGAVGLALNEAMAAGCATICADESGPDSELCEHGVNGLRVPPGDQAGLVAAMERLLSNEQERQQFGMMARETIRTRATPERMAAAIIQAAMNAVARSNHE